MKEVMVEDGDSKGATASCGPRLQVSITCLLYASSSIYEEGAAPPSDCLVATVCVRETELGCWNLAARAESALVPQGVGSRVNVRSFTVKGHKLQVNAWPVPDVLATSPITVSKKALTKQTKGRALQVSVSEPV